MRRTLACALPIAMSLLGCGGSKAPAEEPASESTSESSAAEPKASSDGEGGDAKGESASEAGGDSSGIPTKCARSGSTCTPSGKFVQRLCNGSFPGVALYLFANNSPWTRGYLTGRVKAWNASGGASAENSWLEFDEEVIVLQERKANAGGMQVSGAGGGYDVLRWDGTCATLDGAELTMNKPPSPKNQRVEWRFLDDNVQEALRGDETVNKAVTERKKECKGATSGEVSMKCVKADEKLSQVVVEYVRKGGNVPVPSKLP